MAQVGRREEWIEHNSAKKKASMYVSGIDHLLKGIVEDFGNDAC